MTQRTCTVDECNAAHEAKGLCKKHYTASRPRYPDRKIQLSCAGCGNSILKESWRQNRYTNLYCSRECANDHRFQSRRQHNKRVATYTPRPWPSTTAPLTIIKPSQRVFACGNCVICSKPFICLFGSKTCSEQCQDRHRDNLRREGKHRRRATKRNAYVANVQASQVFRRDNHTCQLCGDPLLMTAKVPHAQAPTIDHIIPLARGGTHEPSNVQAAHFLCNSLKGDRL